MSRITLESTEKYEIIFQSKYLADTSFKRRFEFYCYDILETIIAEEKDKNIDIDPNILSLSFGLCRITDLSGRNSTYEINRPAYKIETLRNPEIVSCTKYMDLMFKFVKYLQKCFEKSYDEIVMIVYTENGPFCKYFNNISEQEKKIKEKHNQELRNRMINKKNKE